VLRVREVTSVGRLDAVDYLPAKVHQLNRLEPFRYLGATLPVVRRRQLRERDTPGSAV
jgi:hypothetical protein